MGILNKFEVLLEPGEVWEYFIKHPEDPVESTIIIAYLNDRDFIGIQADAKNWSEKNHTRLRLVVSVDDVEVYSEDIINSYDCEVSVRRVYSKYSDYEPEEKESVFDEEVPLCLYDIEDAEEDEAVMMALREDELTSAVENLMWDITSDIPVNVEEDVIEDVKEHILEYIARKHGISVFRPMYLVDDDGEPFYEEYPYECMEFDDPTNPVYK